MQIAISLIIFTQLLDRVMQILIDSYESVHRYIYLKNVTGKNVEGDIYEKIDVL